MRSIINIGSNFENKLFLVRLDLNVPMFKHKIIDTNRIDKVVPTLKYLLNKKGKNYNNFSFGQTKRKESKRFVFKAYL